MRQSSTLDRRLFIKAASRFVGATAAAGGLLSLGRSMPGAQELRPQFHAIQQIADRRPMPLPAASRFNSPPI
jgi:hypothetical protein